MDIENKREQEIIFKIEQDTGTSIKKEKGNRVFKGAVNNMKKIMIARIERRSGEC